MGLRVKTFQTALRKDQADEISETQTYWNFLLPEARKTKERLAVHRKNGLKMLWLALMMQIERLLMPFFALFSPKSHVECAGAATDFVVIFKSIASQKLTLLKMLSQRKPPSRAPVFRVLFA